METEELFELLRSSVVTHENEGFIDDDAAVELDHFIDDLENLVQNSGGQF